MINRTTSLQIFPLFLSSQNDKWISESEDPRNKYVEILKCGHKKNPTNIQRPKKICLIIMHFRKKGNIEVQEDLSRSTYYSEDTVIKITRQNFLASITAVGALRV